MPSASRLPELGPRGEGWLLLQLLLGAAIVGCGFVGLYWPGILESFFGILGLLIALPGAHAAPVSALVLLSLAPSYRITSGSCETSTAQQGPGVGKEPPARAPAGQTALVGRARTYALVTELSRRTPGAEGQHLPLPVE